MKRSTAFVLVFVFILLSTSFVSAGWLGDLWGSITGNVVSGDTADNYRAKACSVNNVLTDDGKFAGLARISRSSRKLIDGVYVTSCIGVDLDGSKNLSQVSVKYKTVDKICGDGCWGNYCKKSGTGEVFVKVGNEYSHVCKLPRNKTLTTEVCEFETDIVNAILVCRDGGSYSRGNLAVDYVGYVESEAAEDSSEPHVSKSDAAVVEDPVSEGPAPEESVANVSVAQGPAEACAINFTYGDINNDGRFRGSDFLLVRAHLTGVRNLSACEFMAAEVDCDGVITENDLLLVSEKIKHGGFVFPVENNCTSIVSDKLKIINILPSGLINVGSLPVSVELSTETSSNAECSYNISSDSNWTTFLNTSGTLHNESLALSNAGRYTVYVMCKTGTEVVYNQTNFDVVFTPEVFGCCIVGNSSEYISIAQCNNSATADMVPDFRSDMSESECASYFSSDDSNFSGNKKNMSLYSGKEAFLMSDSDWHDVLPLVPVTTWTQQENDSGNCQRGYGTPEDVCVYPTLIYHEEEVFEYKLPGSAPQDNSDTPAEAYSINGKSLVRFQIDDSSKYEFFRLDLDIARVGRDFVEVVLSDSERNYFENSGYGLEIVPVNPPVFSAQGSYKLEDGYHTYDSMVTELNNLEVAYPLIAKVYDLGDSVQGRDILAMKISDNVEQNESGETEIMIAGNHHAREIMTVEVPISMIKFLLDMYGKDASVKAVIDSHELWFVPMVNPDGHVIVENGDMWWRKNARDNNDDGIINSDDGVDLNRNYGYTWGYDDSGSSSDPYSSKYRGTSEFSEPETQAIRDLVLDKDFDYILDYHSSGGYILYPWGHIRDLTPDNEEFSNLADRFNDFLDYDPNKIGRIADVIYPSNGDSIDWYYGNKSIMGFGFELNPEGGFSPPASYIQPTSEKHLRLLLDLMGYDLVYESEKKIDADSIIHFMQQFDIEKVSYVDAMPQELGDLLSADSPVGADIDNDDEHLARVGGGGCLGYWESYEDVVYVEDDYELALIASTYASLLNVPLIIQGTGLDVDGSFDGKNIICVGSVSKSCGESYDLDGLRQRYLDMTGTKKVILTNPEDLTISASDALYPERTSGPVNSLYGKTSLSAGFLAGAKHELIISENSNTYEDVDAAVENFFNDNYDEEISRCSYSENCSSGFANNPVAMTGISNSITFYLSGKSDLDLGYPSVPWEVMVGQEIMIEIDVNNVGFEDAENVVLEAYELIDSDAPSGSGGGSGGVPIFSSYSREYVLIGSVDLGTVNMDDVATGVISWTPSSVGNAELWFNVSTTSEELNYDNNEQSGYVRVSGPAPDLEVGVDNDQKLLVNSLNEIKINVSNIGSEDSGAFDVELYEISWNCGSSGPCTEEKTLIDSINADPLDSGAQKEFVFEFTPTETNWYDFYVIAELADDIDNWNNDRDFSLRSVTAEPDINLWTNIPQPVLVNTVNRIGVDLRNDGFESAQNTVVDFYVEGPSDDDYVLIDSKAIGELAGMEKTIFFDWLPTEEGYHYIIFNASYEYSGGIGFKEKERGRDVSIPGPDLDVWMYTEDVELGQESRIEIEIENKGTVASGNVDYSVYDEDELIIQGSVLSIDPDDYLTVDEYWTFSANGRHKLEVIVECDVDVDLDNNDYTRYIQVYVLKDVNFEITNNTGDSINRYLGIGYNWNDPDRVDLITEPTSLSIPDVETDLWIINADSTIVDIGDANDAEYVLTRFIRSDLHDRMRVVSEDYNDARVVDGNRLYRIYANEVFWNYDRGSVIFNYPDYTVLGVSSPDNLSLYHCRNWDFENELCLSGWNEFKWMNKWVDGNRLYLSVDTDSAEAFAIGEPVSGGFDAEIRNGKKIDFSGIAEEYMNKQKFVAKEFSDGSSDSINYQISIPGFFYCSDSPQPIDVDVLFNNDVVGTKSVECYDVLSSQPIETSLGGYMAGGIKNVTLSFDTRDLAFYDSSELLKLHKNWNQFILGENDSSGVGTLNVNSFGAVGDSKFVFENSDYTYFVVDVEMSGALSDIDVYLNGQVVGEIGLASSLGRKARGFEIPLGNLDDEELNVTLSSQNSGSTYLADVKMKNDFDDYYLTILGSPDAIPFQDDDLFEVDFRRYGDLDDDLDGELSVGRIMGVTISDVSSYLARVLFYDDLERKTGGTMIMMGDGYHQGIPLGTCGESFCKCYFDSECPEIFDDYDDYFSSFETCNQDLVNGVQQEYPSDCEESERLKNSMFYNSSFSMFADHAGSTGWSGTVHTDELVDYYPQFVYTFGCATCRYRTTRSDLFCTNNLRRGATGYIGAVESMYGHHFLEEFLDETIINNKSIGYAFKIGKNKEQRYDWLVKNTGEDRMGVHDLLIGDPTFNGEVGI